MPLPKRVNPIERSKEELEQSDARIFGALAYLPVMAPLIPIIILLVKKDIYIRFHAIQAILLYAAEIVISIVLVILGILSMATILLTFIMIPVILIFGFGALFLNLYMMYKAYKGEKYKLPVIGNYAENM